MKTASISTELHNSIKDIAMGSKKGFNRAERLIIWLNNITGSHFFLLKYFANAVKADKVLDIFVKHLEKPDQSNSTIGVIAENNRIVQLNKKIAIAVSNKLKSVPSKTNDLVIDYFENLFNLAYCD